MRLIGGDVRRRALTIALITAACAPHPGYGPEQDAYSRYWPEEVWGLHRDAGFTYTAVDGGPAFEIAVAAEPREFTASMRGPSWSVSFATEESRLIVTEWTMAEESFTPTEPLDFGIAYERDSRFETVTDGAAVTVEVIETRLPCADAYAEPACMEVHVSVAGESFPVHFPLAGRFWMNSDPGPLEIEWKGSSTHYVLSTYEELP